MKWHIVYMSYITRHANITGIYLKPLNVSNYRLVVPFRETMAHELITDKPEHFFCCLCISHHSTACFTLKTLALSLLSTAT